LKRIDQVIAEKAETEGSKRKKGRFRDWTRPEDNVNFCTGCENDCLYCYMKPMADNRPTWKITSDTWHQMRIRQEDVDAKQKRHAGLVGFPSSHDILPSNIDDALIVLGKLLRAGNEVLIVSKPRIECIQRICEASQFYKDKILFRFTIGAMDNNLLRFALFYFVFQILNVEAFLDRFCCQRFHLRVRCS
jgi:DNA repair photolyase